MVKVVIISHYAPSLVNLRGGFIWTIINQGHELICLAPKEDYESHLKEIGAGYLAISVFLLNGQD